MPVELTCVICERPFSVIPSRVRKGAKYCSYRCHQAGEGRKGGTTRGEQVKARSQGRTYTKTDGRHAHRVVMEQVLGRQLRPGEIVHHKDGNKLNNAPENLEIISSQSEHTRVHLPGMLAMRKVKHGH